AAPRAGTGEDAAGRQEAEVGYGAVEALRPLLASPLAALLGGGCGVGDAPEGVVQRRVDGRAVRSLEAVFAVPDLLRDLGGKVRFCGHRGVALCSRKYRFRGAESQ